MDMGQLCGGQLRYLGKRPSPSPRVSARRRPAVQVGYEWLMNDANEMPSQLSCSALQVREIVARIPAARIGLPSLACL